MTAYKQKINKSEIQSNFIDDQGCNCLYANTQVRNVPLHVQTRNIFGAKLLFLSSRT